MGLKDRRLGEECEKVLAKMYILCKGRLDGVYIDQILPSGETSSVKEDKRLSNIVSQLVSQSVLEQCYDYPIAYRLSDDAFWYCEEVLKMERPEDSKVLATPPPETNPDSEVKLRGTPRIDIPALSHSTIDELARRIVSGDVID